MRFLSKSVMDTKEIAVKLSSLIKKGDIILLNGDLGVGKTTFTSFLLEKLGVQDVVCSPSFTIVKEYSGNDFKIYHLDLYRLQFEEELIEIGFDEIIQDAEAIKIIEWHNIADDYLSDVKTIDIDIKLDNENRLFEVRGL